MRVSFQIGHQTRRRLPMQRGMSTAVGTCVDNSHSGCRDLAIQSGLDRDPFGIGESKEPNAKGLGIDVESFAQRAQMV